MNDTTLTPDAIRWESRALGKIPDAGRRALFAGELIAAFRDEGVQQLTVFDAFAGFLNKPLVKVILGVETARGGERRSHIVKLGDESEVVRDFAGWETCIVQRLVRSRLFVAVRRQELPSRDSDQPDRPPIRRCAIVYENGYTLFGYDAQNELPMPLHEAAEAAVKTNEPSALSIERVIVEVLGDL